MQVHSLLLKIIKKLNLWQIFNNYNQIDRQISHHKEIIKLNNYFIALLRKNLNIIINKVNKNIYSLLIDKFVFLNFHIKTIQIIKNPPKLHKNNCKCLIQNNFIKNNKTLYNIHDKWFYHNRFLKKTPMKDCRYNNQSLKSNQRK